MTVFPTMSPNLVSCSNAPTLIVSVVIKQNSHDLPFALEVFMNWAASFTRVVVFPVPVGPTIITTLGCL